MIMKLLYGMYKYAVLSNPYHTSNYYDHHTLVHYTIYVYLVYMVVYDRGSYIMVWWMRQAVNLPQTVYKHIHQLVGQHRVD